MAQRGVTVTCGDIETRGTTTYATDGWCNELAGCKGETYAEKKAEIKAKQKAKRAAKRKLRAEKKKAERIAEMKEAYLSALKEYNGDVDKVVEAVESEN